MFDDSATALCERVKLDATRKRVADPKPLNARAQEFFDINALGQVMPDDSVTTGVLPYGADHRLFLLDDVGAGN
jgi:hypothetical protein